MGGYARIAAYVAEQRAQADSSTDVLFVLAGDAADKGALPCRKTQDRACFPLLKMIGVDIAVPGNHEFQARTGTDTLALFQASGLTWTAANVNSVLSQSPLPLAQFSYTGPRSGIDLAVWGWTSGKAGSGMTIRSAPNDADYRRLLGYAASGRPLLIVTHQEYEADKALIGEACRRGVKALALLKAHNHEVRAESDSCMPLVEAGAQGRQVAKLVFAKTGLASLDWKLESHEFVNMDSSKPEQPEVAAEVAKLYRELAPEADERVLELTAPRDVDGVGAFLADAYRNVTHVDIAIVNRGAIKKPFKAGPLTRETLMQTIPYNNQILGLDWNLKDLEQSLCRASQRALDPELDDGAELILSGGKLVDPGTSRCRLETTRKGGSLKVGVDDYIVAHSERWLGRDLRKNGILFRFQVSTEQALSRYAKLLQGKL